MSRPASSAYSGTVVHKRLRPHRHAFSYSVFSLLLDLDDLDRLDRDLRFFSRNRWNVVSFHDADHAAAEARPIAEHMRDVLRAAGVAEAGARIRLLCYPRLFGFVFNPLSVYFCEDGSGRLAAIVYEVSNTFHERKSYVIPVARDASRDGIVVQACAKEMYVSPFTPRDLAYGFHIRPPGDEIVVGVDLRDADGALLKTHFRGNRRDLDDRTIAMLVARHPLMTLKVFAAIHVEAFRLWWKGVPLVGRHLSPAYSFSIIKSESRD